MIPKLDLSQFPRPSTRTLRMILVSVATGALVGLLLAGFDEVWRKLLFDNLLDAPLWMKAVAPTVGLVISWASLKYLTQEAKPASTDEYIRAFHESTFRLRARHLPGKLIASVATLGFGGAVGPEGGATYAGATVGDEIQERTRGFLRRDETKMLLTAGAAAGIAAVFRTPATGVIFAREAPYRDDASRRALLPALLAAATSYLVMVSLLGTEPLFPRLGSAGDALEVEDILAAAAIGLAAGLSGRGFAFLTRRSITTADTVPTHYRLAIGGAVLAILVVASDAIFEADVTMGPGTEAINWLIADKHSLGLIAVLFGFRMVATLTTIGAGGVGGLFFPVAVLGVVFGSFVGQIVTDSPTALYATVGLAAFLGAAYRSPFTAVMFVAESGGSVGSSLVVPALIAAATSQIVAGSSSVSVHQRGERMGHLERRFRLPIATAMEADVLTVPSDATAAEFVYAHVLGRRARTVAVVDAGQYLGMIDMEDLRDIDRDDWDNTLVADCMRTDIPSGRASWSLRDVVAAMEQADVDVLPVTSPDGTFIGLVSEDAILELDGILDETGR